MKEKIPTLKWVHKEHSQIEIKRSGDVVYLSYPVLEATGIVKHGFTTRLGGVSQGVCQSMNLSFSRGDDPKAVQENYRRIGKAIGFTPETVVCSNQIHETTIGKVGKRDCGNGVITPQKFEGMDGMITNEPGVTLATFYADCVPLYLVDPVKKAIGLSHSGWRGTVGKIGTLTVKAMEQEYGSNPKDILAVIGPSICQSCYEVSEDVANKFKEVYEEDLWEKLLLDKGNGKYQLNLWEACRENFLEGGILLEHITMPELCTCCNSEFLFSHRASHGKRGNLAAFLMLK